jgi:hypothetical protein
MLFAPLAAALLALTPLAALAGQIPVVDGVIGGVPATGPSPDPRPATRPSTAAAAAGSLRVTENSGVCGEFIRLDGDICLSW